MCNFWQRCRWPLIAVAAALFTWINLTAGQNNQAQDTKPADQAAQADAAPAIKGWKKGTGWGWIWGKDDEVGALNAMTSRNRPPCPSASQAGQGLRPGRHLQPQQLQVARPQPRRDHDLPQPRRREAPGRLTSSSQPKNNPQRHGLAQLRPVHQRQRRHADRRPGPHHRRRRQPLVQRLQGGRLGRQLRHPQVRRHDHPADRHPRRAARRRRLARTSTRCRRTTRSRRRTSRRRSPGRRRSSSRATWC